MNIKPSSELRNKYNEISSLCKMTREPIFLTVNGHGDTVIMDIEKYNQLIAENELLRHLMQSEQDFKSGNYESFDKTMSDMRRQFK